MMGSASFERRLVKGQGMKDWTIGLRTGIRNALKGHGFTCRADVIAAFTNGEIHFKNSHYGGGGTVQNLGRKGVIELRMWLGLPPMEPKKTPKIALERELQEELEQRIYSILDRVAIEIGITEANDLANFMGLNYGKWIHPDEQR